MEGELFQTEMDFGSLNETFSRDVYQRCATAAPCPLHTQAWSELVVQQVVHTLVSALVRPG